MVAAAQFEASDLRLADVDVVVADNVPGAAQEAVALGQHVEDAAGHFDARSRDLRRKIIATMSSFFSFAGLDDLDLHFVGDLDQFVFRFFAELRGSQHRRAGIGLRKLFLKLTGVLGRKPGGGVDDDGDGRLASAPP